MSDAPIRVGLIGFGFAGATFHAPLISATSGLQLAAIVSRNAEKVREAAPGVDVIGDPDALFARDDIQLVVIATPNDTHAPLARAALAAGKHVVVDKPFTLDLAEARDLSARAEASGRLLSVFHNRRWDSDFLSVRAAIEAGFLGAVTHFESRIERYRPDVRTRWRETEGPGSGLWYDLGPHLIDQALVLFGLPDEVRLSLAVQRQGARVDDWAHAVLGYGARLRVVLQASLLAAAPGARFVVHGEAGSVVKRLADQQEAQLLAGLIPGAEGWGADDDVLSWISGDETHALPAQSGDQRLYYAAVADAVRGAGANPVTPAQAIAVMAVLEAGFASAHSGCAEELALSDAERAAFG